MTHSQAPLTLNQLAANEGDGSFMFGLLREIRDVPVVARFTVNGEPASKSRARWSPNNGRHYTPNGTRVAEQQVGWAFRRAAPGHRPAASDTYGVLAGFFCGTGQRRDVDNMLKLVLDGLNKIAWLDDSQVTEVSGRLTRYAEGARSEVVIYRTIAGKPPSRPCEHCGTEFGIYRSQGDTRRFCSTECSNASRRAKNRRTCQHCSRDFQATRDAKFCSKTCANASKHVQLTCANCGTQFTRAQSTAPRTLPMCSAECRTAYWREHRKTAAKGTCADCAGPTSKKSYTRCQACATNAAARST